MYSLFVVTRTMIRYTPPPLLVLPLYFHRCHRDALLIALVFAVVLRAALLAAVRPSRVALLSAGGPVGEGLWRLTAVLRNTLRVRAGHTCALSCPLFSPQTAQSLKFGRVFSAGDSSHSPSARAIPQQAPESPNAPPY
jgi:hypothetical protein